jgi:predicted ArsR family transcriptional regulator
MRLTAREAADRLGVSYVIAAGLMAHLEETGKAKVVEKKFHSSGKGKPTRIYEVDQNTTIDFGGVAKPEVATVTETVETVETVVTTEPVTTETVTTEPVTTETVATEPENGKIETLDHVAAALARLKSDAA